MDKELTGTLRELLGACEQLTGTLKHTLKNPSEFDDLLVLELSSGMEAVRDIIAEMFDKYGGQNDHAKEGTESDVKPRTFFSRIYHGLDDHPGNSFMVLFLLMGGIAGGGGGGWLGAIFGAAVMFALFGPFWLHSAWEMGKILEKRGVTNENQD